MMISMTRSQSKTQKRLMTYRYGGMTEVTMNKADIKRLAKQMLLAEEAPHDEELARRHAAEWARIP